MTTEWIDEYPYPGPPMRSPYRIDFDLDPCSSGVRVARETDPSVPGYVIFRFDLRVYDSFDDKLKGRMGFVSGLIGYDAEVQEEFYVLECQMLRDPAEVRLDCRYDIERYLDTLRLPGAPQDFDHDYLPF